jgi:transcriptional regulator with XRE-family HTH domain
MRDLLVFGYRDRPRRPSPLLRTMVGDVLRRTRLEQRRTLADVASAARISMQYLSELERGRKEASSEILAALCCALRLDLSELLAAVGRDLLDQRTRPSRIVRLESYRDSDPRSRTGALALDEPADGAAAVGEGVVGPATVDPATVGPATDSRVSPPLRGSGDAVCRLAA